MSDLFSIRQATEADLPYINSYAYNEGMDNIDSVELVWVAVNDEDIPVGFIRLSNTQSAIAHINPIVTLESWRGYGVGRELIDYVLKIYPELRLVSRGSSNGFYERLGFSRCGWDDIAQEVSSECDGCPLFDECGPTPMVISTTDGVRSS